MSLLIEGQLVYMKSMVKKAKIKDFQCVSSIKRVKNSLTNQWKTLLDLVDFSLYWKWTEEKKCLNITNYIPGMILTLFVLTANSPSNCQGEWVGGQREHKIPKHWPAALSTSINLALFSLLHKRHSGSPSVCSGLSLWKRAPLNLINSVRTVEINFTDLKNWGPEPGF